MLSHMTGLSGFEGEVLHHRCEPHCLPKHGP